MNLIKMNASVPFDLDNASKKSRITSSSFEETGDYLSIGQEVFSEKMQWNENVYDIIMQWFQKKGIQSGRPEQIQNQFNQKKKSQILNDKDTKLLFSSGLLERRKLTKKNSARD